MEWIEKLKSTKGKASVCLRDDTVLEIDKICEERGLNCANLSQFITLICGEFVDLADDRGGVRDENIQFQLKLSEKEQELSKVLVREEEIKGKWKYWEDKYNEADASIKKCNLEKFETLKLLELAQQKITADKDYLQNLKDWFARERNRISSWWSTPPPIN